MAVKEGVDTVCYDRIKDHLTHDIRFAYKYY